MRRTVLGLMGVLLLATMFTLMFGAGLVRAQSVTVFVNADGSISPSSAPVSSVDNITYTFTGNIGYPAYDGITIERSNIVLDGNGFTVLGVNQSGDGISLTETNNVTIEDTNIQGFSNGICLNGSSNNMIRGNTATANTCGIYLVGGSSNNNVRGNNVTMSEESIFLDGSVYTNNSINGNFVAHNDKGIYLYFSVNNSINGNFITDNTAGIVLDISASISIVGNNVTANTFGIYVDQGQRNTVNGNNIANNLRGLMLHMSPDNWIYRNDFINNTSQMSTIQSTNVCDGGYPSGGNYWSDYNGTDFFSGPYQNETGSDRIGDTPYVIDPHNTDHYPLMKPYIRIIGDVNGDGKVDMTDIGIAAKAFGTVPGDARWNPYADINNDGTVDMRDIALIARNFGSH